MNKIITLENEMFSAQINVTRGANCISFRSKKYDARFLREPDNPEEPDSPFLYGMPILFPVNRISGAAYIFEGRIYKFPLTEEKTGCHMHGLLHEQDFQVVEQRADFVCCSYKAEANVIYPSFPHDFEVRITYRLTEAGLEQATEVHNLSSENMPVMLGFHTTFQIPYMKGQNPDDIRVMADVTEEIERGENYLPTGRICATDHFTGQFREGQFRPSKQYLSRHYGRGQNGRMYLWDDQKGVGIVYENSDNMDFRLILNNAEQGFICMEPQNCMVDCANNSFGRDAAGFRYVKPGETERFYSRISLAENVNEL